MTKEVNMPSMKAKTMIVSSVEISINIVSSSYQSAVGCSLERQVWVGAVDEVDALFFVFGELGQGDGVEIYFRVDDG